MNARLRRGFTLIELLVAMTIFGFLLVLAMPGYSSWVANSEIRNATESVASGLRYAQGLAISRNMNAQFVLNAGGWDVMMVDTPAVILQTGSFSEGSKNVTVAGKDSTGTASTTVAFNPLGQTITNTASVAQVDVTMPSSSSAVPLRVLVGNGRTGVKMCDPNPSLAANDTRACPP